MVKNYIKTAFRNLWRYKAYALINILGLAIGLASVLLILLYVQNETSYDRFHVNSDRLYRLNIEVTNPQTGEVRQRSIGPYRLAKEMAVEFPDIALVRLAPRGRELVEIRDLQFNEERLGFADDNVFELFTFDFLQGEPGTALSDPFSLVLSESAAKKYFDTDNPVGQMLRIRDRDFSVTGVYRDVPNNSMFDFDVLVSMNCAEQVFGRIVLENWGEGYVETFAMLDEGRNPSHYTERLQAFVDVKLEGWSEASPRLIMQPFEEIYLRSGDIASFFSGGDITYVYAFSFIALFILIIASINYMNLSTARSTLRAREVGLRKVAGADRRQLIGQFLSESTVLSILSLIIAFGLAILALPVFNQVADKSMTVGELLDGNLVLNLVGITLFVGLVAGLYPAVVLSGFKPVDTVSGSPGTAASGGVVRKVLVAFQFATSIFLLVVTAVVYKQLQYCTNADLGYNRDHLVLLQGTPPGMRAKYDQFQAELLKSPRIVNAGASSRVPPGNLSSSLTARPEGIPEDQHRGMQTVWTDFDFIETLGLEIASGRIFSRDFPADASEGFIINESAARDIGWTNEEAINKTFGSSEISDWNTGQWENRDGRIIGVLEDFHFESMRDEIVPTVYFIAPYMAWNYLIRIRPEDIPETIAYIESVWETFNPEVPFEYTFVDESFAQLYENEQRQGRIFAIFAALAIFIACLGLVGLASFTAERKRKEIGIRKVLGASSSNLVILLSKEFTWLVLIAFAVAAPISWYVMQGWLQDFVYRTNIGAAVYIIAGLLAIIIAWITVGTQTVRTAFRNPVDSIRYE